ncbi:kelch-like protein 24 [Aplysia californica]|uniref:Kelch-like protein 24 n=1 Tax=Aplysia californica TaxID=6500 RepID=A0ABM0K4R9_APLCA|nr:kelch-like protein 24 [Aplysia californica]
MDSAAHKSIHHQYLCRGLSKLKASSEHTDTVLVVGDTRFPCHRTVLAAMSPYFSAMFSSGMRESYDGIVTLKGINPSHFEKVLDFLYAGEIELSQECVIEVLQISSMYQIQALQLICEKFVSRDLSLHNCLLYWNLALIYNCSYLELHSFWCILEYFPQLKNTKEFLELSKDELIKYIDADGLNFEKEELVLDAVVLWLDHDVDRGKKTALDILPYLRFPFMDSTSVHNIAQHSSVLRNCKACQEFIEKALKANQNSPVPDVTIHPNAFKHRKEDALVMVDGRRQEVCCFTLYSKKLYFLAKFPYFSNSKAACVHRGELYVSGGYHQPNRMVKFLTEQNRWENCHDLLEPRFFHVMVSVNQYIYILGGYSKLGNVNPTGVERYDPVTDEICVVGEIAHSSGKMSAAACGDVIYMFGGSSYLYDYLDNELVSKSSVLISYNIKTNSSCLLGAVPAITMGSQAVSLDDTIYIFSPNGNVVTLSSDENPVIVHILRSVDHRHFRVVHHHGKFYLLPLAAPKFHEEVLVLTWDPRSCEEHMLLWDKLPRTLLDSHWMAVMIGKQHLCYQCHRR